jgi:hypothetical protein
VSGGMSDIHLSLFSLAVGMIALFGSPTNVKVTKFRLEFKLITLIRKKIKNHRILGIFAYR